MSTFYINEHGILVCTLGCTGECVALSYPEARHRATRCGQRMTTIPGPSGVLERINANLAASAPGLKSFGEEIVIIARRTETPTLEIAFKAAEELARQGLDRQELLKRLEVALLLARC